MTAARHYKTVIPSEASRRLFFRVRSCERVGLRREESLFDVPAYRGRSAARFFSESSSSPALRPLRLCVILFFFPLLTIHYSPLTSPLP